MAHSKSPAAYQRSSAGKEMPSLFIRGLSEEACESFRTGASLRGWTLAQYLVTLLELHESMRQVGQDETVGVYWSLLDLGLQSITKEG